MTPETPDRRHVVRLPVPWHLTGAAEGEPQLVRLLDLSAEGTRIEHAEPVYEGLVCDVDLPPALGRSRLKGRVVWTKLHKRVQTFEGDTQVFYQTGLAFVDLTPEQGATLATALRILETGELPDGT